jgi:hypothetical protein
MKLNFVQELGVHHHVVSGVIAEKKQKDDVLLYIQRYQSLYYRTSELSLGELAF